MVVGRVLYRPGVNVLMRNDIKMVPIMGLNLVKKIHVRTTLSAEKQKSVMYTIQACRQEIIQSEFDAQFLRNLKNYGSKSRGLKLWRRTNSYI